MEITIKINGQAVSVEVSYEVYEYLCESDRKVENLSHQKRRHWDMREFDEYGGATECTHIHIPTPEEILCHRETMCELMAVLTTCTEVQQERFLLFALEGMSFSEIACPFRISKEENRCTLLIYASTLMNTQFDPLHFSIEKLLPQGIFILAGSGKNR